MTTPGECLKSYDVDKFIKNYGKIKWISDLDYIEDLTDKDLQEMPDWKIELCRRRSLEREKLRTENLLHEQDS